jgi:hypothetical protein
MAIEHISQLRREFPSHFVNKDPKIREDEFLRIPTKEPISSRRRISYNQAEDNSEFSVDDLGGENFEEDFTDCIDEALTDMPIDEFLDPLPDDMCDAFGGHPGGLRNDPNPVNGTTIIERLAFYLPFHIYDKWWGIYILPEGIQKIRSELQFFFKKNCVSAKDQVKIAKRLLYHHEYYHHSTESFATRLEAVFNCPIYINSFQNHYINTFGTKKCLEETCANSYSREKTIGLGIAGLDQNEFRDAIDYWFRGTPPGYAQAVGTGKNWGKTVRPKFYEDCLNACAPSLGLPHRGLSNAARTSIWSAAGHFDRGVGDIRGRISYLIKKSSPIFNRLPLDARTCLKGRSFKQKLVNLQIARFLREGSAHEIWAPLNGGRTVPIPRHDGVDIPKGTMRAILRQLGSNMSIDDFLAA